MNKANRLKCTVSYMIVQSGVEGKDFEIILIPDCIWFLICFPFGIGKNW